MLNEDVFVEKDSHADEKPVKITEKFTEDRLINGWLYGNMKI